MKKLYALPMLLMIPSCSTIQSTRENLAQMSDEDFNSLGFRIHYGTRGVCEILSILLQDKQDVIEEIQNTAKTLGQAVETNAINSNDIVGYIIDQLSNITGLEEEEKDVIRSAGYFLNSMIGPIQIGIDGVLTDREKLLLHAFLSGVYYSVLS